MPERNNCSSSLISWDDDAKKGGEIYFHPWKCIKSDWCHISKQGGFQSRNKSYKIELEGQRSNVIVTRFAKKIDWLPDILHFAFCRIVLIKESGICFTKLEMCWGAWSMGSCETLTELSMVPPFSHSLHHTDLSLHITHLDCDAEKACGRYWEISHKVFLTLMTRSPEVCVCRCWTRSVLRWLMRWCSVSIAHMLGSPATPLTLHSCARHTWRPTGYCWILFFRSSQWLQAWVRTRYYPVHCKWSYSHGNISLLRAALLFIYKLGRGRQNSSSAAAQLMLIMGPNKATLTHAKV